MWRQIRLGLLVVSMLCVAGAAHAAIAFRSAAYARVWQSTISYAGQGNVATAVSGNITPTLSSVESNALLVCAVEQRDNVAISFPSGWVQLYSLGTTTTHRASLFYKVAAATEANPLITHTGGNGIIAQCATFRGVNTSNPLDVAYAARYAASSLTVSSGSLATLTANDMMLYLMHVANNPLLNVFFGGTGGVTWTQRFYNSAGLLGSTTAAIGLYTGTKTTAGTVGPISATITALSENHGVLVALRNGSTAISINVPAGTLEGDVMVAAIATTPSTVPITAPAGWTLIQAVTQTKNTSNRVSTYYRVATASEPASYTWTLSSAHTGAAGGIVSYSGVDPSAPVDVSSGQTTNSNLNHTAPTVTTTAANDMLVTVHEYASASSWTPPPGMTERVDIASQSPASSSGITLEMNDLSLTAAGATGTKTATAATSRDTGGTVSIALRAAGIAPDHIEIDYSAPPFSTCAPTAVKVYACANPTCSAYYTGGVSVTLSPGGNVVTIPSSSGSGDGTVFQTSAGAATLGAVAVPAALTGTTCKNLSSGTFSCGVTFSAASLSVSVPNLVSGNAVTGTISGCKAQLGSGTNSISFYTAYQNPSSGSKQVTINGTTTIATSSPGTTISLNFSVSGSDSSATFSLSYPDVGAVGLTASTASGASGSASFISVPHHFELSAIACGAGTSHAGCKTAGPSYANPAATDASGPVFMIAGNPFSLTVTAYNSAGAVTPNFGKEFSPERVNLTPTATMPDMTTPWAPFTGNLSCNTVTSLICENFTSGGVGSVVLGGASAGAASNSFVYDEAGIMTITAALYDPDSKGYLSIGNQALNPAGTVSATIGRFIPDHFTIATDPASPILTRADFTQVSANATGTAAPATVINVDSTAGFNVGDKVRIPGAGAGGNALTANVTAVDASALTLTLDTAISTALNAGDQVIDEWGSYMGEQFNAQFSLNAVDANGNTTQNYQSVYAKLNPTVANLMFGAVNAGVDLSSRLDISSTASSSFTGGAVAVAAPLAIKALASPDGPYAALQLGIAPIDTDGVTSSHDLNVSGSLDHTSIMNATVQAVTEVRYGRIKVSNGYGSELLPLALTATAQYYTAYGWVDCIVDSVTGLTHAASYAVAGSSGTTTATPASATLSAGKALITLSKPSAGAGVAKITPTVPGYLQLIPGTATFGVYKNRNSYIYRRESY